MDKIIEFINNQTNNKYLNLLFFGATYKRNDGTMQIQFTNSQNSEFGRENIVELTLLCKKYFGNLVKNVSVTFKTNSLTMQALKDTILNALSKQTELVSIDLSNVKLDFVGDKTVVIIPYQDGSINENAIQVTTSEIKEKILEELNYDIELSFQPMHVQQSVLSARKDRILEDNMILEDMKNAEIVDIKNVKAISDDFDFKKAYLAGYFGDELEITTVGIVKSCSIRETKPKEEGKTGRKFMALELEYDGLSTRCTWFLNVNNQIAEFEQGITIAVHGKKEEYLGRTNIRISNIAKCTFEPPKKVWRKCPNEYRYVKPEPYEFTEQTNLLFNEKQTTKEYLLNNTFVVYDLETTGLNPQNCKIIDIGAFKIVNGKIVEKFCTFVNPECEIPAEASKINRITNAMVANCPTIDMALPDFYKFCQGSIIAGYNNIGFDDLFIEKESKRLLYNFDNKREDVMNIAKSKIFGLHNYKLGTVCAYENVPLIDAHRAASDALATAKLFIKLIEKYC